jgi:hypothetical protein
LLEHVSQLRSKPIAMLGRDQALAQQIVSGLRQTLPVAFRTLPQGLRDIRVKISDQKIDHVLRLAYDINDINYEKSVMTDTLLISAL